MKKLESNLLESISFIPTPDGDYLLTIEEAAFCLKTHPRTVERQIEDEKLPVVKVRSKRRIRWSVLTGERKVEA